MKSTSLFMLLLLPFFFLKAQTPFEHKYQSNVSLYGVHDMVEQPNYNLAFLMQAEFSPIKNRLSFHDRDGFYLQSKQYEFYQDYNGFWDVLDHQGLCLSNSLEGNLIWGGTANTITQVDANGNPNWSRAYIWDADFAMSYDDILQDQNGDHVAVGAIQNGIGLQKIDANGNLLWALKKHLPAASVPLAPALLERQSGTLLVSYIQPNALNQVQIWETDPYGSVHSVEAVDFSSVTDQLNSYVLIEAQNGDLLLVVAYYDNQAAEYRTTAVRFNTAGQFIWAETYAYSNGYQNIYGVHETPNEQFIIHGILYQSNSLTKIEGNGQVVNAVEYPYLTDNSIQTSDMGYAFSGVQQSNGNSNLTLFKTGADMLTNCNDDPLNVQAKGDAVFPIQSQAYEISSPELEIRENMVFTQEWSLENEYSCIDHGFGSPFPRKGARTLASPPTLFPNPSHGRSQLAFKSFSGEAKMVIISDLNGRTLYQFHLNAEVARLKLPLLASGLYIVRVQASNKSWQQKLVIQ